MKHASTTMDVKNRDIKPQDDEVFELDGHAMRVEEMRAADLIVLTARLAQLLAEEADLLESMKISKIPNLQHEKLMLTNALEAMKKHIAKYPEVMDELSDQERDDLESVVHIFNEVLEENYRRLSMARAVNLRVVQAITEIVQESTKGDVYDRSGITGKPVVDSVSVTLNEKV